MIDIQRQRPIISQLLVTSSNISPSTPDFKIEIIIDQKTKIDDTFEKIVFDVFTESITKSYGFKDRVQNILMQENYTKSNYTEKDFLKLQLYTKLLRSGLESVADDEFEKNVSTYSRLEKKLMDDPKYRNKYVVIYRGQIVDFGDNKEKLLHDAYSKYGYVSLIVHKVGTRRVIHHLTPFRR